MTSLLNTMGYVITDKAMNRAIQGHDFGILSALFVRRGLPPFVKIIVGIQYDSAI